MQMLFWVFEKLGHLVLPTQVMMLFWVFEKLGHLVLPSQLMMIFWVFDHLGLLQQRISTGKSLEQASVWVC